MDYHTSQFMIDIVSRQTLSLKLRNNTKRNERPTKRSCAIPPLIQVCSTLRYLASNTFHQVVDDTLNIAKSSAHISIWRCLRALVLHLPEFVRFPYGQELVRQKQKFAEKANFPNVVGLIDGTQVRIIPPAEFENAYVNRKSFYSINVQGVCDSDGFFTDVTAMWLGSAHDSRVFSESALCQHLEHSEHFGHLLGNSGYGCKIYLLTPYLTAATQKQEQYNEAHKRTGILIEQVFGRLKRRFSILHGELRVKHSRAPMVIVCCVILHNLAVKHRLPDFDQMDDKLPDDMPQLNGQNIQSGLRYRDMIIETFF